ncbi:MAG: hypothetical protein PUA76_02250 [Bacteroidales bacterium]|nr:hypothetical protein [Bacteroidales bacterium]
MKKLFTFAALSILSVGAMYAQEHSMRIHFNDGTSTLIKATDVAKITFESGETPQPGSDKMVDMGLSVKWAAWNVGGTKPSDYGNFYAYGETEPKTEYTIDNYKWLWEDWNDDPTLYEEWEHYLKLGATIAGTNYDVAHVKWGDQWRMPTREEWTELINSCKWSWTAIDGVSGMLATSQTTGNSIFLPAAGNMVDADHTHDQVGCFYWTASEYDATPEVECRNYRANLDGNNRSADGYDYPEVGFSVRAVYGPAPDPVDDFEAPTEAVDLGLSVKWAPYNLGAFSDGSLGIYLCWGEYAEKYYTHRYNYKYYDPITDSYQDLGESICGTQYDCATRCWGEDWRLPTAAEMQELIDRCTWTRSGYNVIITGPNGNHITLPAGETMNYRGKPTNSLSPVDTGYYLTGDAATGTYGNGKPKSDQCKGLRFQAAEGTHGLYDMYRGVGVQVRPVHK